MLFVSLNACDTKLKDKAQQAIQRRWMQDIDKANKKKKRFMISTWISLNIVLYSAPMTYYFVRVSCGELELMEHNSQRRV